MSAVLHHDLFESIPLVGGRLAESFEGLASHAAQNIQTDTNISVVVRTLNEAAQLEQLLEDIDSQVYSGEVEVVVVDNESSDKTPEIAKSLGASVVTLARDDFSYPRSMNLGMEAASHDLVWLTVGHALASTNRLLQGGARNFYDESTAGAFSVPMLPNRNASRTERVLGMALPLVLRQPQQVTEAKLGTLGASSAMIRKSIWKELGTFDERYETGGEDTAMGAKMLEAGYGLCNDPLLAVHHSHGLGPIGNIRQLRGWMQTVRGPVMLDKQKLVKHRPHLNFE